MCHGWTEVERSRLAGRTIHGLTPTRTIHGTDPSPGALPAGHGADDQERLVAHHDRIGERGVRRLVRQIPLAGEEAHERPALDVT